MDEEIYDPAYEHNQQEWGLARRDSNLTEEYNG